MKSLPQLLSIITFWSIPFITSDAFAQEYSLDKENTSYDDLLDGLRLSLKGYDFE
jgi:hypothetical protein